MPVCLGIEDLFRVFFFAIRDRAVFVNVATAISPIQETCIGEAHICMRKLWIEFNGARKLTDRVPKLSHLAVAEPLTPQQVGCVCLRVLPP